MTRVAKATPDRDRTVELVAGFRLDQNAQHSGHPKTECLGDAVAVSVVHDEHAIGNLDSEGKSVRFAGSEMFHQRRCVHDSRSGCSRLTDLGVHDGRNAQLAPVRSSRRPSLAPPCMAI